MTWGSEWVPAAAWGLFIIAITGMVSKLQDDNSIDELRKRADAQDQRHRDLRLLKRLIQDNKRMIELLTLSAEQLLAAEFVESPFQLGVRRATYDRLLVELASNMQEMGVLLTKLGYPESSP